MPSYVVNGRKYSSIDEMSAEDRQAYQQAMNLLDEGGGFSNLFNKGSKVQTTHTTNVSQHHVFEADSDEMNQLLTDRDGNGIPDIMEVSDDQMSQLFTDRDGNGVPDILEGRTSVGNASSNFSNPQTTNSSTTWKTPTPTADPLGGSPLPWNQPQQSNGFMLGLVVGGVVIGAALLIWLLLM